MNKINHIFETIFLSKYKSQNSTLYFQVKAMAILYIFIAIMLGLVLITTNISGRPLYTLIFVTLLDIGFLFSLRFGYFNIIAPVSLFLFFLGVTLIVFFSTSIDRYEMYKMSSYYLVILFLTVVLIRKPLFSYSLLAFCIISLVANYYLRGINAPKGDFPELNDYVVSILLLVLTTIIINYLNQLFQRQITQIQQEATQKDATNKKLITTNEELSHNRKELHLLRDYLRCIIDSMPSFIVSVNTDCTITQFNQMASTITKVPFEDAFEKPLEQIIHPFKHHLPLVKKCIQTNKIITLPPEPLFFCEKTNEKKLYELTIYPLKDNLHQGAVLRLDDVTAQVRIQNLAVQNEKMLSIGGLAAGMAHEINNPLGGILQSTFVIKNRLLDDIEPNYQKAKELNIDLNMIKKYSQAREIPKMLGIIESSSRRAARIVQNMLKFSRKDNESLKKNKHQSAASRNH